MSRGDNTQGTGGAGTGSGSGGGGSNSGGGGGTRPTKLLALALAALVVGLAILATPLVDRWADATTRPAFYVLALLAVYAACMHVTARTTHK